MQHITIESIAEVCHETNRAYCRVLGDFSQPSWQIAPEWQKQIVLASVVFRLTNPAAPPATQHSAWLAAKRLDGWTLGAEKNPERKTHPLMVPYDQLLPEQRLKAPLFQGVVDAMKEGLGFLKS